MFQVFIRFAWTIIQEAWSKPMKLSDISYSLANKIDQWQDGIATMSDHSVSYRPVTSKIAIVKVGLVTSLDSSIETSWTAPYRERDETPLDRFPGCTWNTMDHSCVNTTAIKTGTVVDFAPTMPTNLGIWAKQELFRFCQTWISSYQKAVMSIPKTKPHHAKLQRTPRFSEGSGNIILVKAQRGV